MTFRLQFSILKTLQRALLVVLAFVVMGTLSGCGSIEPSLLLDAVEEAQETDDATNKGSDEDETGAGNGEASPVAPPAWATVDLSVSYPEQAFDEPLDVWFYLEEANTTSHHKVGRIAPPGQLTFDTSSELPESVLSPFVESFLPPYDGFEVITDGLEFTPADAAPKISTLDLFEFGVRPSSPTEPSDSTEFPYVLATVPMEDGGNGPFVVLVYTDRAVEASGIVTENSSSQPNNSYEYYFDLDLEQGFNLMRLVFSEGATRFDSDLRGETINWIFYDTAGP